jgi:hypothetical protein
MQVWAMYEYINFIFSFMNQLQVYLCTISVRKFRIVFVLLEMEDEAQTSVDALIASVWNTLSI